MSPRRLQRTGWRSARQIQKGCILEANGDSSTSRSKRDVTAAYRTLKGGLTTVGFSNLYLTGDFDRSSEQLGSSLTELDLRETEKGEVGITGMDNR